MSPSTRLDTIAAATVPVERTSASHDHIVQFYDREDELNDVVVDFLEAGLAAGEPALVIATEPHRRAFHRCLSARGVDLDPLFANRRFTLLDARATLDTFMLAGMPDPELFAAQIGGAINGIHAGDGDPALPLRAYGEMVDILWKDGFPDAAVRLEELWNDLARRHSFSLLCAYETANFHDTASIDGFDRICQAHTHVFPAAPGRLADPRPDRAEGVSHQTLREICRLRQRAQVLESEVRHRRQLEAALRESLDERRRTETALRSSDRRKDEFLAMLAHELRNPLAPIVHVTQLLRNAAGEREDMRRHLELLDRQTHHLTNLIDDLLEVSRITQGKIRLKKELIDAAAVVGRAVEICRPLIDSRNHTLTVTLPHEPLWVEADSTRLSQILGNLLNNAAKYTDEGGRVWLTADREGSHVVFRVRDTGIGITPDLMPRLFEMFAQADTSLDRSEGGLGIGLTLVRGLVDLHDGTVEARSAGPGHGSEFIVRLPLPSESAKPMRPRAPWPGLGESVPIRIVVVDDNLDAATTLGELLRVAGHHVAVAHDGPSTLELVRTHRPDVVLLDIGLPRMDGYEVARQLREEHRDRLKVIALTGYGQNEDRRKAAEAGFDHHLVKPVDLSALGVLLTAVTDGQP